MATSSHSRAALITLAGSMAAMRIHGSVRVEAETGTDEPIRDRVGAGQEGDVAVPLRQGVRVGPLEIPDRELEFRRKPVAVPPFVQGGKTGWLPRDHDDLPLPEPELLERPAAVVERVAHEFLQDD